MKGVSVWFLVLAAMIGIMLFGMGCECDEEESGRAD